MRQSSLFDSDTLALSTSGGIRKPEKSYDDSSQVIILRDYQISAVESIFSELQDVRSTMIEMATGTGKTVTLAYLSKLHLERGGFRVLIVVCRDEHIFQTVDKVRAVCGPKVWVQTETQETRAARDREESEISKVVVAMVDTIAGRDRLVSFHRNEFDLVIFDECHHVVPVNRTYWSIHQWFNHAKIVGVSAIAERSDGRSLGNAFETCPVQYQPLNAIIDGWLVPIVQQYITCENYDLSKIRMTKKGDFDPDELDHLVRSEGPLQGLCNAAVKYSNHGGDVRQTIIFAASASHCEVISEILNRRHRMEGTGKAHYVVSKGMDTFERRLKVREYLEGEVRYLVNFGSLVEGFDAAETRVVLIGRPCTSLSLYKQMVGRGLRPHPSIVNDLNHAPDAEARRKIIRNSIKPSCFVGDMVGASAFKLVKDSVDVLAGWDKGEVIDLIRFGVQRSGSQRVMVDLEILKARDLIKQQAIRRRRDYLIDCEVKGRPVDPFNVFDVVVPKSPKWMRKRKPTFRMIETLKKGGYDNREIAGLTYTQAKSLLNELFRRWENGLCTYKQARLLSKWEYDTSDMSFEEATKLIDTLSSNGWKRPD